MGSLNGSLMVLRKFCAFLKLHYNSLSRNSVDCYRQPFSGPRSAMSRTFYFLDITTAAYEFNYTTYSRKQIVR